MGVQVPPHYRLPKKGTRSCNGALQILSLGRGDVALVLNGSQFSLQTL
jgi:hypothetical protein